jgi:hypothetical protein
LYPYTGARFQESESITTCTKETILLGSSYSKSNDSPASIIYAEEGVSSRSVDSPAFIYAEVAPGA